MMRRTLPTRALRANDGFAMVVVAALFIAFAVISAVAVERNTAMQMTSRRDTAVAQLTRLSNAILEYAAANQSGGTLLYPCPAREDVLTTSATFGAAAVNCQSATGDSGGYTSTNIALMNTKVLRGMVPVQTLAQYGIGLNDAFDPWNNRIAYVVNRELTLGSSVSPAVAQLNNPTINLYTTPAIHPRPDFILISYGRDGMGATKREATSSAITCTAGGLARQQNCTVTTTFNAYPTTGSNAASATYFDDVVTYYTQ